MQRNARNSNAIGNGFEFGRHGRGKQRKIRAANFGGIIGTHGKQSAIGSRGKIGSGIVGRGNGKGVRRGSSPLSHRPARRGGKRKVNGVPSGIRLEQRSANQRRKLRLRGWQKGGGAGA